MTVFPRGDERERAVELAGDRLGYLVLAFGVLAVVMYRSLALAEASWDLLAVVVMSGVVKVGYRVWQQALPLRLTTSTLVALAAAAGIAIALVYLKSIR
jgi:hypothetical protein